jgi:ubiquinone biosynthesis monooxygenase Coq7
LLTIHTLETMAINVYKTQISRRPSELNRQLIGVICNEMTHAQDIQVKLFEYRWRASVLRWAYWVVGLVVGVCSRIRGAKSVLRTDIWLETKAVRHYRELLDTIDWDADTRRVIERDRADEAGHVSRWTTLLRQLTVQG